MTATFLKPADLVAEFWAAPPEALFAQPTISAVLDLSQDWCERARWSGNGPPYIRIIRAIRYRKADIIQWIDQRRVTSTSAQTQVDSQ